MATTEQIRRAMHRHPFVPITLRLVDGTSYVIKHPDFIAVPPTPREATYYEKGPLDAAGEYTTHLIDLGLVLEVIVPGDHPVPPPAASAGP